MNINRNASNSFPKINDALRFCLLAEKVLKTNFCVHFGSGTINICLKLRNYIEEKPS